MNALGDPPQPFRSMVDRIHTRHDGQEHLRRTNVARRLFTSDVLFAGLQRKTVGRLACDILGHSDDAPRHLAFECLSGCKERSVRSAESKRNAKSLAGAHSNIGPEFSWWT